LDYQFLQNRLFNGLSIVYTFLFVGRWIKNFYEINEKKIGEGDAVIMADIHSISSVRKRNFNERCVKYKLMMINLFI
jgi:hypothetical protein